MCGFTYDEDYGGSNRSDNYTISIRLSMYYSYQKNHKPGETTQEYYKRVGWKYK